MIDREQIRRDAEGAIGYGSHLHPQLARHCLTLLDELEQAEKRELHEANVSMKQARELGNLKVRVPALVEALRAIARHSSEPLIYEEAAQALDAFEAEQ